MNIGDFGFMHQGLMVSWTPSGEVQEIGERPNPYEEWGGGLTGRLFVGLNVNDVPTHHVDDVVALVKAWREARGKDPSASFIAQRGIFKSKKTGKTVVEDSCQVVIFPDDGQTMNDFRLDMIALGESLARDLSQELIILEVQKNGVTQSVGGIKP